MYCNQIRLHAVSVLLIFLLSPSFVAAQAIVDFICEPITTELQELATKFQCDVYLQLRCDLYKERHIEDSNEFELRDVETRLRKLHKHGAKLRVNVRYHVFRMSEDLELKKHFEMALRKMVRGVGFSETILATTWTDEDLALWSDRTEAYKKSVRKTGVTEPKFSGKYINAYPVRTGLSTLFYDDAELVVFGVKRVDIRNDVSPEGFKDDLSACIKEFELTNGGEILFSLNATHAGMQHIEDLFGKMFEENQHTYMHRLIRDLGFKSFKYRCVPYLGSVEDWIDKVAKDFELTRLDGSTVAFSDEVSGRPALLTFWGIPCGPCVREAPHLTALHEKYGDRFAIVAVDAYPDSSIELARFVRERNLTHPVFCNGKEAAYEIYRIGSCPTSFWINADGKVVDFTIGFGSDKGSVKGLEEKLLALLAENPSSEMSDE